VNALPSCDRSVFDLSVLDVDLPVEVYNPVKKECVVCLPITLRTVIRAAWLSSAVAPAIMSIRLKNELRIRHVENDLL